MDIRPYDPADLAAVQRIWKECGWIESDTEAAALESFYADAIGTVAVLGGDAECSATVHRGAISYAGTDLPLAGVTSVTTSLIGRKQGLAKAVTADVMARAADDGAAVALLGIFEQGFYDLLGFGSGPYSLHYRFDPASLTVPHPQRAPVRLSADDVKEMHQVLGSRRRSHGGIRLDSLDMLSAELAWESPSFGLGFRDANGQLTHFIWGKAKGESGPYQVNAFAYHDTDQLFELLGLIKSLGDQVRSVDLMEPAEIQIQDLIRHPNRQRIVTRKTDFEVGGRSQAWWQARILDLSACVAARSWGGPPVVFNLELSDPMAEFDHGWRGVSGEYTVTIAETSIVEPGSTTGLQTLDTPIGPFTRMWLGARPASSLALTTALSGPDDLLAALDVAFRLPTPNTGLYL
jgi:predicted acetyltransferase